MESSRLVPPQNARKEMVVFKCRKNRFECGAVGCFKRKMKQETRRCAQCDCGGPDLVCRSLDQQWYWAEHFKTGSEALGHGAAFCSMYIYIYYTYMICCKYKYIYIYIISVYIYIIYIHIHSSND